MVMQVIKASECCCGFRPGITYLAQTLIRASPPKTRRVLFSTNLKAEVLQVRC
jgi:hypothetical protein